MPFRAGWRRVLDLIQRISVAATTTTIGPRKKIATAHSSGRPTLVSPNVTANQHTSKMVLPARLSRRRGCRCRSRRVNLATGNRLRLGQHDALLTLARFQNGRDVTEVFVHRTSYEKENCNREQIRSTCLCHWPVKH